ncbi:MAG: hypothetical protein JSS89_05115 [Bacteroidetes bacterium]|nr:hypothetical protein [Bacteroidota bacterium]
MTMNSAAPDEVVLTVDTVRATATSQTVRSTASHVTARPPRPRPVPVPRPTSSGPSSTSPRTFSHIPTSTSVRPSRSPASATVTLDTVPIATPTPATLRITTQRASIAFNAPDEIQLDDVQRVQLRLSVRKTVEELKQEIVESGSVESAAVNIGNVVTAKLSGDGFEITELTPAEQGILEADDTEWRWQVTPTEPGEHFLNVSLSTKLNVDGKEITRSIKTYEHQIRVNVTVGQMVAGFVSKNWQWLWAVVVAPMAAFGWKKMRKRVTSDE